jgi:hypothetical protein
VAEWNEGRLDDLGKRVDDLGTRMDRSFARVDQRFEQVHEDIHELHVRFAGLQRTIIQMGGVVIAALIGLIATQV